LISLSGKPLPVSEMEMIQFSDSCFAIIEMMDLEGVY